MADAHHMGCSGCGKPTKQRPNGNFNLYCSKQCNKAFKERARLVELNCLNCGAAIRRRLEKRRNTARLCKPCCVKKASLVHAEVFAIRRMAKRLAVVKKPKRQRKINWKPRIVKHCEACGKAFQVHDSPSGRLGRFCSRACAATTFRRVKKRPYARQCVICHVQFSPLPHLYRNITCSVGCNEVLVKENRRAEKAVRRARERTRSVTRFSPLVVFQRDDWTCRACGCHTPQSLRGTNEWNAPELDHIVPLAAKGAHDPENCQLLCRTCNLLKGTKSWAAFMREMGAEAA